jgi:hypothetical protein
MLEFATHRILFSTIFLYAFAYLMMMRLICVIGKFAFVLLCFVIGFF